jgi:hypothetical protein
MMKDMKPNMIAEIMGNFSESDCKRMMMEIPPEMREKCMKMMTSCLETLKEAHSLHRGKGSDPTLPA